MKTSVLRASAIVCSFFLIFVAISSSSCKKKDETCIGEVYVYDSTGWPLPNCSVKMYHQQASLPNYVSRQGDTIYVQTTDILGHTEFKIKLPAVYNIRADHPKIAGKHKFGVLILNEPGSRDQCIIHF